MADEDERTGRSAAWGVVAAVFGGGAVATWTVAAAPGSRFPIWPAYVFGLVAVIGLYMCFAVLHGWRPAKRLHSTTPQPIPDRPSPGAIVTTARKTQSHQGSAISPETLRDLIVEGEAMQARVAGRRGPLALVPSDLPQSVAEWKEKVSAVLASRPDLLAQFQAAPPPSVFALHSPAGELHDEIGQHIRVLRAIVRGLGP